MFLLIRVNRTTLDVGDTSLYLMDASTLKPTSSLFATTLEKMSSVSNIKPMLSQVSKKSLKR